MNSEQLEHAREVMVDALYAFDETAAVAYEQGLQQLRVRQISPKDLSRFMHTHFDVHPIPDYEERK